MEIDVLILGEGATDVGIPNGFGQWEKGCIMILIEKINEQVTLNYIPVQKKSLPTTLPKKDQGKFRGHGKNIQKLVIYSHLKKIAHDIVVYYGDTDKESGANNSEIQARKASKQAYEQAHEALDFFNKKGFAIIPLRMLESWLLADPKPFEKKFGRQIELPNTPELLWGNKNDPESQYPKHVLDKTLSSLGSTSNRQVFCELVQNINLDKLYKQCPISFPPFFDRAKNCLCDQTGE